MTAKSLMHDVGLYVMFMMIADGAVYDDSCI